MFKFKKKKELEPLTEKEKAEIWKRFYKSKEDSLSRIAETKESIQDLKKGLNVLNDAMIAAGYYDYANKSKNDDTLSQEEPSK